MPLVDAHDALLVDLDGVVQLDDQPVPGAADVLREVRQRRRPLIFLTNNAARTPTDVVARLGRLGVGAHNEEILSSAMAAAHLLAQRLPPGSAVLIVGGPGLVSAVEAAGLRPVTGAADGPVAVVQGWAPEVSWAQLAEAAVALNGGAAWIATNLDRTLPSPRGPLPGNGSLVAALRAATGCEPESAGKPARPMFDAATAKAGARRPLVVGDRLDTDIAGACAAGLPSLAVLTGVAGPRDLLAAPAGLRPTYIGADLQALLAPAPPVTLTQASATCRTVTVTAQGELRGDGAGDGLDGLRAACALAWSGRLRPDRYDACLAALGLD